MAVVLILLFVIVFEIESHCVALASLEICYMDWAGILTSAPQVLA